eukprot:XP_001709039.1 Hypothetical protein GL50803_28464 [Giardia lamblia ATCC 50803]
MFFYNTLVAIAFGTVALILLVAFPFLILLEQPDYPMIWTQLAIPTWLTKVFYVLFPTRPCFKVPLPYRIDKLFAVCNCRRGLRRMCQQIASHRIRRSWIGQSSCPHQARPLSLRSMGTQSWRPIDKDYNTTQTRGLR